uniref:RING-type domain-containing protein n=2 Tax=Populus alba TaxID=43335 RepID=A0A4U5MAD0_POPAL|nr:hypothetical protein D5086_0000314880 [Populus alba]
MGRLPAQTEAAIQHFSHPHPLQLSNYQPQQTLCLASCSGCKLKISGWIYACTQCNYFLHVSCSQMPQQITHPYHQNHVLSLLSTPMYPGDLFNCDACGKQGNGFSYNCGTCNIYIHTTCAAMPLVLTHLSHHHQLNLTPFVPYPNMSFSCDICHNFGSKQWLYRCNLCGFDAHLDCAVSQPNPSQAQAQYYQSAASASGIPRYQAVGTPLATGPVMRNLAPNNYVPRAATSNVFGSNMPMSNGRPGGQANSSLNQLGSILLPALLGIGIGGLGGGGNNSGGGINLGGTFGGGGGDLSSSLSGVDIGGFGGGMGLGDEDLSCSSAPNRVGYIEILVFVVERFLNQSGVSVLLEIMDLDLNQEPLYPSNDSLLGLASIRDELENTHGHIEERLRQLEAVTFRARQRQRWRQSHFTPQTVNVSVEPATVNVRSDGGLLIGEASVATEERRDEMNKFGKRKSTYLIAKALGRNGNGKKARTDRRSVFDCNICLDMAQDPILTCCGHLFCWPCFYRLSYVYSNVKECPVCVEEVTDTSIIPIYGNGNSDDNKKLKLKESGLKVPPRPSAQRVESVRQQLINHGAFSSSIEERMRYIGNVLIAMGEIPPSEGLDGVPLESDRISFLANRTSTSQALPSIGADSSHHHRSVQVSRLLFQGAASLSSFSSAVNSAMESAMESTERLFEDLGAILHSHRGRRNHQQSSRPADRDSFSSIAAVIQPDSQNPDTVADADSTLPRSGSSSRPDDVVTVSQLESHRTGTAIESNFSVPISSSSRRRNLVFRLSEVDNSVETNSSSSRRRIEVPRAPGADNGHNRERRRRSLN